ncbi:hypothetical protein PACTADRAFT_185691 [Pachysolen tannophilus NRRL Y-2460]|uniref:K Homology domain-containing protein n=1 Tax=Pachysolen tannophilus NRRL Y-2460 TaxID=669874 RepID=A0A1E4U1S6_PACTA|nr:hypothetical protein PACTADRAFT_185691 [Pachysolen tannophilus NRRL Y-2460]
MMRTRISKFSSSVFIKRTLFKPVFISNNSSSGYRFNSSLKEDSTNDFQIKTNGLNNWNTRRGKNYESLEVNSKISLLRSVVPKSATSILFNKHIIRYLRSTFKIDVDLAIQDERLPFRILSIRLPSSELGDIGVVLSKLINGYPISDEVEIIKEIKYARKPNFVVKSYFLYPKQFIEDLSKDSELLQELIDTNKCLITNAGETDEVLVDIRKESIRDFFSVIESASQEPHYLDLLNKKNVTSDSDFKYFNCAEDSESLVFEKIDKSFEEATRICGKGFNNKRRIEFGSLTGMYFTNFAPEKTVTIDLIGPSTQHIEKAKAEIEKSCERYRFYQANGNANGGRNNN